MRLSAASAPSTGQTHLRTRPEQSREEEGEQRGQQQDRHDREQVARVEDRAGAAEQQATDRGEPAHDRQHDPRSVLVERQDVIGPLLECLDRLDACGHARRNQRGDDARRDADAERRQHERRADRNLASVLRHAEHFAHQGGDRGVDAARQQDAGEYADGRSNDAGDGALAEEDPPDLRARGAERAQDADLRSAFGHGDRKRVVDDEHPDEEREEARDAHHQRERRDHRLELLAAPGRWLDLEPGAELHLERALDVGERRAWREGQIDAIERAPASEHLLSRVDVHDREIAAKGARQSRGRHHAADREGLITFDGAQRDPAAKTDAVTTRELTGQDDRIGLREEHQRVVDDGLVSRSRDRSRAGCDRPSCRPRAPEGHPRPQRCCCARASMTGTATRTPGTA